NPIGTVHGGFAATMLDSALGCAIFSTIEKGDGWTTLELQFNLVRPLTKDTGPVRAEGRVVRRGRTVARNALCTRHHDVHDLPSKGMKINYCRRRSRGADRAADHSANSNCGARCGRPSSVHAA